MWTDGSGTAWSVEEATIIYSNWNNGEPNNIGHTDGSGDCVEMYLDGVNVRGWNDLGCNTEKSYVCEFRTLSPYCTSVNLVLQEVLQGRNILFLLSFYYHVLSRDHSISFLLLLGIHMFILISDFFFMSHVFLFQPGCSHACCRCFPSMIGRSTAPPPATEPPATPAPAAPGSTMEFFVGPVSWGDAEEVCVSVGGHLVSIHTQDQNDAVSAFVTIQDASITDIWIGLTDVETEVS